MSTPATSTRQPESGEQAPPDSPLTTKEGWRRYVEHETVPPKLLTAAERAVLSGRQRAAADDRRREYHAELPLVNTPTIRKVISTARLLIQLNRHQVSARRGVILSGASGTGKTTALTQLGRAHELATRKPHPHDRARLPVVYVTVPPAATPKMLAQEFARFFGLTFPARATHTDIVDAVCATAAHVHVDLVLVDELHNLNLGSRAGAEASDQLKYFAERLPATFAYAGIDIESQGLDAVLTALMLCAHIWSPDGRPVPSGTWDTWDDRLDILIPFDRKKQDYIDFSTSRLFAAVYPEAVALAPLIASAFWRRLAGGTEAEQARYFAEVARRVTYPYKPTDRSGDAVAHWALADSWRPPSRPLITYKPGRVRGTLPGLAANRLARHERSAKWFSRSRRNQGRYLLFHGHLKPALLREREDQYVKWEGTVWHSERTDDQMKEQVAKMRRALEGTDPRTPHQRPRTVRSW